jgi:SAM-dependent methyltransferase
VWIQHKVKQWRLHRWKFYAPLMVEDALDRLRGRTDPTLPPKHLRYFIGDDGDSFRTVGDAYAERARDFAGLKPDDRVLDVGSGIGRLALPLTSMISEEGSYDGLEIVPHGVRWCRQHITPSHPNFRFHHADIANRTYNPRGKISAEHYVFPFAPNSFDLVVLLSVFTHLLPATTAHYLEEIERVLAPKGRMLSTFYLLNDESERLMDAGRSQHRFACAISDDVGDARVVDPDVPENAVALPDALVRDLLARTGLIAKIYYGNWCGRDQAVSSQDMVIATKP